MCANLIRSQQCSHMDVSTLLATDSITGWSLQETCDGTWTQAWVSAHCLPDQVTAAYCAGACTGHNRQANELLLDSMRETPCKQLVFNPTEACATHWLCAASSCPASSACCIASWIAALRSEAQRRSRTTATSGGITCRKHAGTTSICSKTGDMK